MDIKAIFFDIDGTLVSFKTHRVTDSNLEVLDALKRKGIKVFISTGRMLGMTSVLDGIEFDGYIANNGAAIYDSSKKMIHGRLLPKKELYSLRERLALSGKPAGPGGEILPPFAVSFMTSDNYYLNCQSDKAEEVARIVGVAPPIVSNIDNIVEMDVFQMCVYLKGRELDDVMEGWLTGCTASVWNPVFADVNEKGITKAYGIDRMLEIFGIDLSETLSFGDGGNDIPMLEHTALSVCMGNADDAVRAVSDYVTETVDEDGVAKALARLSVL
ncbi:MAG: HAD family hydrolase [Bacteroidales bacterium]|nr:HAD family hydrolase [Bacteroidales bacterium]